MTDKKLFIERREEGDYAVKKAKADRASAVFDTQAEAIKWARDHNPGHSPDVERVRYTNRGKPDQWRKA